MVKCKFRNNDGIFATSVASLLQYEPVLNIIQCSGNPVFILKVYAMYRRVFQFSFRGKKEAELCTLGQLSEQLFNL